MNASVCKRACVCMCVYHLNRCKTSNIAGGSSTIASLLPTKTLAFGGDIWPDQPDVPAFFNLPFFSEDGNRLSQEPA